MNSKLSELPFFKYQATGNDFILIDNRDRIITPAAQWARQLCDRKFGIGSDGLIFIQAHSEYDFEMVFYNPDGSQSLCGNGSRCAVNFARKLGLMQNQCTFLAYDGPHHADVLEGGIVRLQMADVLAVSEFPNGLLIDTGSPHLLLFTEVADDIDVAKEGRAIRNNATFRAEGVNVNFIETVGADTIYVRTYERGVEAETLSCGTGVTASALAAGLRGMHSPVLVKTKGGNLKVGFRRVKEKHFTDICLTGPAEEVFSGTVRVAAKNGYG